MLRNVLANYLDSVSEIDFFSPFFNLLSSNGFYDIHLTHGNTEFGKDFIAKKSDGNGFYQYSFQIKKGNIGQSELREIQPQLFELNISGLTHPNFDHSLEHRPYLVITGELVGNAKIEMTDFNRTLSEKYKLSEILFWGKENLLDLFELSNLEQIYFSSDDSIKLFGDFFVLYGKGIKRVNMISDIEKHSRKWLTLPLTSYEIMRISSIEAELLAGQAIADEFYYEAIYTLMTFYRLLIWLVSDSEHLEIEAEEKKNITHLQELVFQRILVLCEEFFQEFKKLWITSGKELVRGLMGEEVIVSYLVNCSRIIEITGFLGLVSDNPQEYLEFLIEFINTEPGTKKVLSDNYSVGIIPASLFLLKENKVEEFLNFQKDLVIWLCDKFEEGIGLASYGSSPIREVEVFFGEAFEFIKPEKSGSFLSTIVSDLASFSQLNDFYNDVINDIRAVGINNNYWQLTCEDDFYRIDTENLIYFPAIEFSYELGSFDEFNYAEHIKHELECIAFTNKENPIHEILILIILLRDRYFPKYWNRLLGR
ncbi:MAG: hypothetical protein JEZ06_21625 [Anaerolineaceae bacterium]|nr:hypothetical protein [Anaerolineaceae bacterium]